MQPLDGSEHGDRVEQTCVRASADRAVCLDKLRSPEDVLLDLRKLLIGCEHEREVRKNCHRPMPSARGIAEGVVRRLKEETFGLGNVAATLGRAGGGHQRVGIVRLGHDNT
jgi:hypothetical protein